MEAAQEAVAPDRDLDGHDLVPLNEVERARRERRQDSAVVDLHRRRGERRRDAAVLVPGLRVHRVGAAGRIGRDEAVRAEGAEAAARVEGPGEARGRVRGRRVGRGSREGDSLADEAVHRARIESSDGRGDVHHRHGRLGGRVETGVVRGAHPDDRRRRAVVAREKDTLCPAVSKVPLSSRSQAYVSVPPSGSLPVAVSVTERALVDARTGPPAETVGGSFRTHPHDRRVVVGRPGRRTRR